ncbi:MAG: hypothetical protein AAGE52_29685 [Myxococcota bacterium]
MAHRRDLLTTLTALGLVLGCAGSPASTAPGDFPAEYLTVGITYSPEGQSGYGTILPSLAEGTQVSLDTSVVIPGLGSLSVPPSSDGVFYVGLAESPRIQRFEAVGDGTVTMTGEVDLLRFGAVTGAGILVVPDGPRGYLFNVFTRDLIVFDTEEMTLIENIDIDLGQPEGVDEYYSNVALIDGDRVVITTLGVRPEDTTLTTRTRAVFVDIETSEVTYADSERCGGLTSAVKDASGNLYFGPILRHGSDILAGTAGDSPGPLCILRIASGATEFDEEFVDLFALTGGRPAGGLSQGAGDTAFLVVREEDAPELTPENVREANLEEDWSYHAIDLTDPTSVQRVPGIPSGAGYSVAWSVRESAAVEPTPFLVRIDQGFGSSTVYDVSDPLAPVVRLRAPGAAVATFRLR